MSMLFVELFSSMNGCLCYLQNYFSLVNEYKIKMQYYIVIMVWFNKSEVKLTKLCVQLGRSMPWTIAGKRFLWK